MRTLPLTQGLVAKVSDRDYAHLSKFKWSAMRNDAGQVYAVRISSRRPGPRRLILMHRLIAETPRGFVTDHRDHDGLNNQRRNLRTATMSQNAAHRKDKWATRGVTQRGEKFEARIGVNGKSKSLGFFDTAEAAARAYKKANRKYFGSFGGL